MADKLITEDQVYVQNELESLPGGRGPDAPEPEPGWGITGYLLVILGLLIFLFIAYSFMPGDVSNSAVTFNPAEAPDYHIANAFDIVR